MKSEVKRKSRKTTENLFVLSIVAYPLLLFLVFYVGINLNSFLMAFQKISINADTGRTYTFNGLENFRLFIEQIINGGSLINISFLNSLKMYAINLVICMPLYILFSYLLFRKCFAHRAIRLIVMIPQIVSGFVICMLFRRFIDYNGALPSIVKFYTPDVTWVNLLYAPKTSFGTTIFYMIWISFSTSLIVYPNAMKEISDEILESGQIDGIGNMVQELRYIVLPLIYPTVTTFLITGFAAIFTTTGPLMEFYMYSAPSEVYNMGYYYLTMTVRTGEANYPVLAAGGLIMTLIIAPLTHLLKYVLERFGPSSEV